MTVIKKIERSWSEAANGMGCFRFGVKDGNLGSSSTLEMQPCVKDDIKNWLKSNYSIYAIALASFPLEFMLNNLVSGKEIVNAKLSIQAKIIPNVQLAEFLYQYGSPREVDLEHIKDEISSSSYDLRGFFSRLLDQTELVMLDKYGRHATSWEDLAKNLPEWIYVEKVNSFQVLNNTETSQNQVNSNVEEFNHQLKTFEDKIELQQQKFQIEFAMEQLNQQREDIKMQKAINAKFRQDELEKHGIYSIKSRIRKNLHKLIIGIVVFFVALILLGSCLPCRVELTVEGRQNAEVVFDKNIKPAIENLAKIKKQAVSQDGTKLQIECATMSKSSRAKFQEVLNDLSHSKHYIDWEGGKPKYSFDSLLFFIKKSHYILKIKDVPLQRINLVIVGNDKEQLNDIHTYLTETFKNVEADEILQDGEVAIKYSLEMRESDINNSLLPKFESDKWRTEGYNPALRKIVFYMSQDSIRRYEVDISLIKDEYLRHTIISLFEDSSIHINTLKGRYSAQEIESIRRKLAESDCFFQQVIEEDGIFKVTLDIK